MVHPNWPWFRESYSSWSSMGDDHKSPLQLLDRSRQQSPIAAQWSLQHRNVRVMAITKSNKSSTSQHAESSSLVLDNWWNISGLTICSKCVNEIGWSKSKMELDGTQVMEMATRWWSSAQTWKRRKRKTKWAQGKGIKARAILFCPSRHNRVCDWV
jgi:hypothetical protein